MIGCEEALSKRLLDLNVKLSWQGAPANLYKWYEYYLNRASMSNGVTATLVYQHRYKSLGYIVDAGQVDRQHALPEFIGMIQEFVASRITGVIDQDIYPT